MTRSQFLTLLQVLYQGLNLMATGIKRIIDQVKAEQTEQS